MILVISRELYLVLIGIIMTIMQSGQSKPKRFRATSYKNKAGVRFRAGDQVKLKKQTLVLYRKMEGEEFAGRRIIKAKILYVFPDLKGLVRLETRLGGYWTWDVEDLEKAQ